MVLYAEKKACQAGGWCMKIRQAVTGDGLLLSSLNLDVQRLHAQNHPDTFKMPESEDFAGSFFEEILADPAIKIFIAEEDGKAIGYLVCKLVERLETPFNFPIRYLLVDQISVQPQARRKRIGEALLKEAELLARQLDAQRIQLDSWDFNLGAHVFFEQMGFQKFSFRFWKHL
jgi:GNAT superfamily N-acetyltransferase